jgi:nucleotide-binding universal stress UspA family protein
MFKHILVPLDGSALAEQALEKAKGLALENGATLTLLRVFEPEQTLAPPSSRLDTYHLVVTAEKAKERAEVYLAEKYNELIAELPDVETVALQLIEKVGVAIAHYAEEHEVDLIVMTSHGYTGVRRWILGSVTTETICEADCPVLVLPAIG